jgi:hypothetical protein
VLAPPTTGTRRFSAAVLQKNNVRGRDPSPANHQNTANATVDATERAALTGVTIKKGERSGDLSRFSTFHLPSLRN